MATHHDHENERGGRSRRGRASATSSESAGIVPLRAVAANGHEPDAGWRPPDWITAAENHSILVHGGRLRATTRYLFTGWRMPRAAVYWGWRGLRGVVLEIKPIAAGAGKLADAVYGFSVAPDSAAALAVSLGTTHAPRAAERHANVKTWRRRIIAAAVTATSLLGLWLGFYAPEIGIVTLVVLVGILDLIGRRGKVKSVPLAQPSRPLTEGMPTHLLRIELDAALAEERYDELISVGDVVLDVARHEYHARLITQTEIKPELLRQIERRISAPANSISVLVDETNSAEIILKIQLRNPLANVPEAPWIPAGKLSAWEPIDLGVSVTDMLFALVFARTHVIVVGKTGSGKTKVHICNIIDRLSACRDAVLYGIDLQNGPTFPMWRSVLQEAAYTVGDADALLDEILGEMSRRATVLKDIAEDDDPDNDTDEWIPELGPALIIFIDEFPQLSKWDGTKLDVNGDKPNLLAKVETVYRLGRKFGISFVIGIQKTGNDDTGSTVISSQSGIWIVGPCEMEDTVRIFGKEKRNAGYAPHILKAATPKSHNDAGMAVIDAAGFGPDPVRGYKPFSVKARAMRREAEWKENGSRPVLPDTPRLSLVMDAVTVPPALAALDAAFAHHNADILGTAVVVEHANSHGGNWTQSGIAAALKKESPDVAVRPRSGRCRVQRKSCQAYHRDDLSAALRALEGQP